MAVWLSRSGNVARHLNGKMGSLGILNRSLLSHPEPTHQRNSLPTSPIEQSYRNPAAFLGNSGTLFAVRHFESIQAETHHDSRYDEHENQVQKN
uniref:Uncharacterized protein n=1 Tax=Nelumbo nucifera TaxID=4432 RepID=A0A822Z477_NELNU|nr:TPA_asm: hypothetical protein HUJ06_014185 [Nelumbo nucifera]